MARADGPGHQRQTSIVTGSARTQKKAASGPPQKENLARANPSAAIKAFGLLTNPGNRSAIPGTTYSTRPMPAIHRLTQYMIRTTGRQFSLLASTTVLTMNMGIRRRKLRNSDNLRSH